jgi:hypothetical protein
MDDIRRQLVILCRRCRARQLGWPRDWRAHQVTDPRSGAPFTEPAAWDYIAEVLEQGHAYEVLILDRPPGAKAYVLKIPQRPDVPEIYVKVQLGAGIVIGRSFHYSNC